MRERRTIHTLLTAFGVVIEIVIDDGTPYISITKVHGITLQDPILLMSLCDNPSNSTLNDIISRIVVTNESKGVITISPYPDKRRSDKITIIKDKDVLSIIRKNREFIDRYIIQHRRETEEIIINNFAMIGASYSEHTQEITKIEYGWDGVRSKALFETIQI